MDSNIEDDAGSDITIPTIDDADHGEINTNDSLDALLKTFLSDNDSTTLLDFEPISGALENAVSSLNLQIEQLSSDMRKMQEEWGSEQSKYKERLSVLHTNLEQSFDSYSSFEKRLSLVGRNAISVGEQLNTVDTQRIRALQATQIFDYFILFSNSTPEEIQQNWLSMFGNDVRQAALLAKRLSIIARDMDSPKTQTIKSNISVFHETIERYLLDEFDKFYHENDRPSMQRQAFILFELNQGVSCVQRFLSQHRFFLSRGSSSIEKLLRKTPPSLSDPTPGLVSLCHDIKRVCDKEREAISDIFQRHDQQVLLLFIERIYEQILHSYLQFVLSHSPSYVSSLSSAYNLMKNLSANLTSYVVDNHAGTLLQGLFSPYIKLDYIEKEKKQLDSFSKGIMNELKQAIVILKREYNENLLEQVFDPEIVLSSSSASECASLFKDCLERLDVLADAISYERNVKQLVYQLYETFLSAILQKHFEEAILLTLHELPPLMEKYRRFLPLEVFKYFSMSTEAMLLVEECSTIVIDMLHPQVALQRQSEFLKQMSLASLEAKLNLLAMKLLDVFTGKCNNILNKQQHEYCPQDEDIDDEACSETCLQIIEFVQSVHAACLQHLDAKNVDKFLTAWGLKCHQTMTEHFKRCRVNEIGSVLFVRDITEYQQCFSIFKSDMINEKFEQMRQVSKLFTIPVDDLKEAIHSHGNLMQLDKRTLIGFLGMRSDFRSKEIYKIFND